MRRFLASLRSRGMVLYVLTVLLVTVATAGVMLLLGNIAQRREEAQQHAFRVVEVNEDTIDPAIWGKNYPLQYDSYLRTVDVQRTKHGGSEAFQKLEEDPRWRVIFNGYAFSIDYREERGHAYMLNDQRETQRVLVAKQYGNCLHCHAAVLPAYREQGLAAGVPADEAHRQEAIMRGFALVNTMPYSEATRLVAHPVTCLDCHDPNSMQLRVTRPGFLEGINALAQSGDPLPHLPSIERWRAAGRAGTYDPNTMATRLEMRSFVCGQCHVEYYFKSEQDEQWRLDFIAAENSLGFHADQEAARILAEAIDFARQGQLELARQGGSASLCLGCHPPAVATRRP